MDYTKFCSTPEELIIYLVKRNLGSDTQIVKDDLLNLAKEKGIGDVSQKMTKEEIAIRLAEKLGHLALIKELEVGVSSYDLQERFGISNEDVKRMAQDGFLTVTGSVEFKRYGKYLTANLYSPYDYFKSREEVDAWLAEHLKKRRKSIEVDRDPGHKTILREFREYMVGREETADIIEFLSLQNSRWLLKSSNFDLTQKDKENLLEFYNFFMEKYGESTKKERRQMWGREPLVLRLGAKIKKGEENNYEEE